MTSTTIEAMQHYISTSQYLVQLQQLSLIQPQDAQNLAWAWIEKLGKNDDQSALLELFSYGVAENPCTPTLGMPVGPMRNIAGGRFISTYLKIDSPWTGKTFHRDGSGGFNRIKAYTKIPVTILAPFHRLSRQGSEYIGFRFDTSVQKGAVEPKVEVIAIEYAKADYKNPSLIIPLTRVRDELVKILPHTYLGRATYPDQHGQYQLVGYFALKRSIGMEL